MFGGFLLVLTGWLVLLAGGAQPASAQLLMTQDEALRSAFPDATRIERRTAFLADAEVKSASSSAGSGVDVKSGVVSYYVGMRGSTPLGAAYFDVHRVRTLPEVVMVVVTPSGEIEQIKVLKFSEPPEYRAPDGWLEQFRRRRLAGDLSVGRSIVNMTGATLTSQAITRAARRVLALHRVIAPFDGNAIVE